MTHYIFKAHFFAIQQMVIFQNEFCDQLIVPQLGKLYIIKCYLWKTLKQTDSLFNTKEEKT